MTSLNSVAHGCAVSKASHYPSLELCKKLTEIGFPETEKIIQIDSKGIYDRDKEIPFDEWESHYDCPSVMEMLDAAKSNKFRIDITTKEELNPISLFDWTGDFIKGFGPIDEEDMTIPDALANAVIFLHENNYISFSK